MVYLWFQVVHGGLDPQFDTRPATYHSNLSAQGSKSTRGFSCGTGDPSAIWPPERPCIFDVLARAFQCPHPMLNALFMDLRSPVMYTTGR